MNDGFTSDAKNFGIKKSNYDLIAFMDCDMDFPKNWLEIQFRHIKKINKPISLGQVNLTGKSIIIDVLLFILMVIIDPDPAFHHQ